MQLRLVRHATLELDIDGTRFLVDPMLDPEGARPPIQNTPTDDRNPTAPFPSVDLDAVDAVVVTHLHEDHIDDTARDRIDGVPVFCQPEDTDDLEASFDDVRPVSGLVEFEDITIAATPARHGTGDLAEQMGPVTGFLFEGTETTYVAGDTVWYGPVGDVLTQHEPDTVVVNTGEAQFVEGDPITMSRAGVASVADITDGEVVAVHMESINHCLCTREDLREHLEDEGVENVTIPADGERV
ncbi:MBL fold metallo-hydrolase [Halosegnis longus]|uniref:MBL fold metallo-hydrolase n=1 Tax=Halosegnis longus TaxID=2216012 RepID=UPI00096A6B58|nr:MULTISPECIES: MBL fold metallo-hydrolase [Halobacteriales]